MNVKIANWLLILTTCLLVSSGTSMQAQNIFVTKAKVLQELEDRGLELVEVEQKLSERGIDLNFLDQSNITAEQIQIIREVILEMEQSTTNDVVNSDQEELDSLDTDELLILDSLAQESDSIELRSGSRITSYF